MGKKLAIVSFLCGALSSRRKNPIDNPKKDHDSTSSSPGHGGVESSPPPEQQLPTNNAQTLPTNEEEQQNIPLPPPPGRLQPQQMRSTSYHHHHRRSTSGGLSKFRSSLSMKIGNSSRREDCGGGEGDKNKKTLRQEDSIWKKTIILGEKCRVPDEDDDTVLRDEKGNRISTYRLKNNDVGSVSRPK